MTGAKASAVLAASGGLVAAFALPASATPEAAPPAVSTDAAPVAAPGTPAISAPALAPAAKGVAVGVTGVKVVAKPKPKPRPVLAEQSRESRVVEARQRATSTQSTSRSTSRTSTAPKATTPKPSTNNAVRQSSSQIVNIARGLLGIAYVYGGETPAGFDCSGFTQYVYGKAGISLPRTASQQQRQGTRVSTPKPGDLVFYGSPAWHVGIFTGGDMMIDSPKPGKSSSERNMFGTPTEFRRY
ncbi:glycoside hydrolase [Knoellia sinensis KCTC 19936]|uniref:Glycoside hydrolase n=1 Tax=Knoellia sinensis KCTC 19936 TaxID=1385520 RepID=A0A0A0J0M1_9MICO|nr:glycoside hydrolase [Knoellia sinensis KCTC 19936]